jgi:hypothetical protein
MRKSAAARCAGYEACDEWRSLPPAMYVALMNACWRTPHAATVVVSLTLSLMKCEQALSSYCWWTPVAQLADA